MSDEENNAIEKVKEVIEIDKQRRIETIYDEKPLFREQLQTLLDLIEKQQKEIADLNEIKQQICNEELITQDYVQDNFIAKDKIREKIKDYDKWIEETYESVYLESLQAQKYALEELLEDGDHIPRID